MIVWTRDLTGCERSVLAEIGRGCDPLPSEQPIVTRLQHLGLIKLDFDRASNASGWLITHDGKRQLQEAS